MIHFKVTLLRPEVMPLMNFIIDLLKITEHSVESIDYMDYYNIRHFCKMLFDKNYSITRRKVHLKININIYDSLLQLYNLNEQELRKPENVYQQVIYRNMIWEMDKQRENLMEYKTLSK